MTPTSVAGAPAPASYVLPDRFLRLTQVMELTAFGKTHIYGLISAGQFPAPYKPGGCASRWSEKEVLGWLAECMTRRAN